MRAVLPLLLLLLAAGRAASDPSPPDGPAGMPAAPMRFGTGFRIGPEHLLTAAHVVAGCGSLWAAGEDVDLMPAQVGLAEPGLDVALLRAGPQPPPYARLAATPLPPGTELVATGYLSATLH